MFGLTFEKLFLVAIIAGVVIGPQRLPYYAHRLAETIRTLRDLVETSRSRAATELGILDRADWEALDPRRYDPRRIVRDALETNAPTPALATRRTQYLAEQAHAVRPGQKYLVTGTAAHPRRIRIDSLPADDPRRIAAQTESPTEPQHREEHRTDPHPSPRAHAADDTGNPVAPQRLDQRPATRSTNLSNRIGSDNREDA